MNAAFAALGLQADACEAEIKKAYAARLRKTRPDTDPAGFQRLHAAYKAALAYSRRRSAAAAPPLAKSAAPVRTGATLDAQPAAADVAKARVSTRPGEDESLTHPPGTTPSPPPGTPRPSPPATSIPATPTSHVESNHAWESVSPDAFARELCEQARSGNPDALLQWLRGQPYLWSLHAKRAMGGYLLRLLLTAPTPMPAQCFDQVAGFFGYLDVLTGADPLLVQNVRERCASEWLVLAEQRDVLVFLVFKATDVRHKRRLDRALARLSQRTGHFDLLRAAVTTRALDDVSALIHQLTQTGWAALPQSISRSQAQYWLDAASITPLNRVRAEVLAWRFAAALALTPVASLLIALAMRANDIDRSLLSLTFSTVTFMGSGIAIFALVFFAISVIGPASRAVARWIRTSRARPWLYGLALVLAACGASLGFRYGAGAAAAPLIISGWIVLAAWLGRWRGAVRKLILATGFGMIGILGVGFFAAAYLDRIQLPPIIAPISLVLSIRLVLSRLRGRPKR